MVQRMVNQLEYAIRIEPFMVRRVKDDTERLSKESETIVHETSRRG